MNQLLKPIVTLALTISASISFAQRPAVDEISTSKGVVKLQPVEHASMVLNWNNKNIYIDPYNGAKLYEGLGAPDLIFITDIHPDHLDLNTLNALDTKNTLFIVSIAVAEKLPDNLKGKSISLSNGQTITAKDISINAVAMYNLPESEESMHPRGRGNGYILTMGGKKFYISGDTGDTYEMRTLKDIDVAFVCMNKPYTMNEEQAANAVLEFKPKIVYPYHYRNKEGFSNVEEFKKLVNEGNKDIDVRIRNWYPETK